MEVWTMDYGYNTMSDVNTKMDFFICCSFLRRENKGPHITKALLVDIEHTNIAMISTLKLNFPFLWQQGVLYRKLQK